jgi:hypothetical protein
MSKDEREKLILKIKRLVAVANSKGATEEEAATFAEKAQVMLAEYNLSMSDVEQQVDVDDTDVSIVINADLTTNSYPWRRPLASAVAEMYFCKYFYTTRHYPSAHDQHSFLGTAQNVLVAKMMFKYLIDTVDRLAKEGALLQPAQERSPYRTSFRAECVRRLIIRIGDRIEQAKRGEVKSEETGRNLPALLNLYEKSNTQLTAYMKQQFPRMRHTTSRLNSGLHSKGYEDGRAAGNKIGLDQQVGGNKPKGLLR